MAKAIAIILMVLAHTQFSQFGIIFINMFHMSLFFFMSGYCFNESYLCNLKGFVIKKVKGLYFPYVKWSIAFLALHNIFFHLNIYNNAYASRLYEGEDFTIKAVHIVTRMFDHEQLLGGFWFLRCLLVSSFVGFVLIRYCSKNKKLQFASFLFCIFFAMVASYFNKQMHFIGIDTAQQFIGTAFFFAGFLFRKNEFRLPIVVYPFAIITIVCGSLYLPMSFADITYWKIMPWFVISIMGCLTIFDLCKLMELKVFFGKKLLIYIGNNTLSVLALHFLCFKIVSLAIICFYNFPIEQLAKFPTIKDLSGWWIAYLIIGVMVPIVSLNVVKKFINMIRNIS